MHVFVDLGSQFLLAVVDGLDSAGEKIVNDQVKRQGTDDDQGDLGA